MKARSHEIVATDFLKEIDSMDSDLRRFSEIYLSRLLGGFPGWYGDWRIRVSHSCKVCSDTIEHRECGAGFYIGMFFAFSLRGMSKVKRMNVIDDILKTLKAI